MRRITMQLSECGCEVAGQPLGTKAARGHSSMKYGARLRREGLSYEALPVSIRGWTGGIAAAAELQGTCISAGPSLVCWPSSREVCRTDAIERHPFWLPTEAGHEKA